MDRNDTDGASEADDSDTDNSGHSGLSSQDKEGLPASPEIVEPGKSAIRTSKDIK